MCPSLRGLPNITHTHRHRSTNTYTIYAHTLHSHTIWTHTHYMHTHLHRHTNTHYMHTHTHAQKHTLTQTHYMQAANQNEHLLRLVINGSSMTLGNFKDGVTLPKYFKLCAKNNSTNL